MSALLDVFPMEREFDVIVFGASGFTGELVVEEIARNACQQELRWAVAGRNRHKVLQILVEVGKRISGDLKGIKIFEADVTDQATLELMCENTVLLINCVGPYTKYGEPVIAACLKKGTHVVDFAVEISHLNLMMLKYHHEAETKEVYIITGCGLAYLYFEMIVPFLQEKFEGGIDKVDVHIKPSFNCRSVHFATWESYVNMSNGIYEILVGRQKIYSEILKKTRSKWNILSLSWPVKFSKQAKGISFTFPSILHTAELGMDMMEAAFQEKPVKVHYYMLTDSVWLLIVFIVMGFFLIILYPFSVGRRLLTKYSQLFSCGLVKKSTVSEKTVDTADLKFTAVAKGWSQRQNGGESVVENPDKTLVFHGSGPTVYKNSAICLVQAALIVLQETHRLPNRGGMYTPISAFWKTSLPTRLQTSGITYEEKDLKK